MHQDGHYFLIHLLEKILLIVISKLYQIWVVQILLYGHENLTLQKQEGRRIEPAKVKLLRSVAGYNDLCMTKEQMKKWEWNYNVHNLSEIIVGYRCKWT